MIPAPPSTRPSPSEFVAAHPSHNNRTAYSVGQAVDTDLCNPNPDAMRLQFLLAAVLFGGCDLHGAIAPDSAGPVEPTVTYRIVASSADTVQVSWIAPTPDDTSGSMLSVQRQIAIVDPKDGWEMVIPAWEGPMGFSARYFAQPPAGHTDTFELEVLVDGNIIQRGESPPAYQFGVIAMADAYALRAGVEGTHSGELSDTGILTVGSEHVQGEPVSYWATGYIAEWSTVVDMTRAVEVPIIFQTLAPTTLEAWVTVDGADTQAGSHLQGPLVLLHVGAWGAPLPDSVSVTLS